MAAAAPLAVKAPESCIPRSSSWTTKNDNPSAKKTNQASTTALSTSDSHESKNFEVGLNIRHRIAIGPSAKAKVRITLDSTVTNAPSSKKTMVPVENIIDANTRSSRHMLASRQMSFRMSLARLFAVSSAPNTVVGAESLYLPPPRKIVAMLSCRPSAVVKTKLM